MLRQQGQVGFSAGDGVEKAQDAAQCGIGVGLAGADLHQGGNQRIKPAAALVGQGLVATTLGNGGQQAFHLCGLLVSQVGQLALAGLAIGNAQPYASEGMYGISLGLRTAIRQLERTDAGRPTMDLLSHLADEVDTTVGEVKRIVRDLRPSALDELGLMGAVAEFARSIDGAVQLHVELPGQEPALPAAVEVAVYRIVTEALTNVVRHANAGNVWVELAHEGAQIRLRVRDDGQAQLPLREGFGLSGMRERLAQISGRLDISRASQGGLALDVQLPLQA